MMILHSGFFLTISEEFPLIRIEEKSTPKKIVPVVFDMRYLYWSDTNLCGLYHDYPILIGRISSPQKRFAARKARICIPNP